MKAIWKNLKGSTAVLDSHKDLDGIMASGLSAGSII